MVRRASIFISHALPCRIRSQLCPRFERLSQIRSARRSSPRYGRTVPGSRLGPRKSAARQRPGSGPRRCVRGWRIYALFLQNSETQTTLLKISQSTEIFHHFTIRTYCSSKIYKQSTTVLKIAIRIVAKSCTTLQLGSKQNTTQFKKKIDLLIAK